jgi:hypothetical protein
MESREKPGINRLAMENDSTRRSEELRVTEASWVRGDLSGLDIPADIAALTSGGADFLTRAFRSSGALSYANHVERITQAEECFGGGTGRKMLLAVEYEIPTSNLPTQLFVKFSRNFDDPMRDRSKHMMVPEVKFAALSRTPNFPITVPECLFADVHAESGTGLMITERLAFGKNGVEPQLQKCMDYDAPQPFEHYAAIIKALARLSGTHKAGHLHASFNEQFGFDLEHALAADPMRYSDEKLLRRVTRIGEFIGKYPQLFPTNLANAEFREQFVSEAPRAALKEAALKRFLYSNQDLIALCHWNANIDNGWFWRNANGELECGLMDWGRVGQMTVAQTIYGAFSGAEKSLWDEHLDDIIALFAKEYHACGGPSLNIEELKIHTLLVTAMMGLAYLMDAPAIIERQIADLDCVSGPTDERFRINEDARVQLHMLTMFLNQWQTQNLGALIEKTNYQTE